VKRRELLRHLEAHGCTFVREGANHTIYQHQGHQTGSVIPRHADIHAHLARKICKDLGIPMPTGK
jgi:mRNA interferase HicA